MSRPSHPSSGPARRAALLAVAVGLQSGCVVLADGAPTAGPPGLRSEPLPPALVQPGSDATLALEQARAAGSSAALIMFLARYPDAAEAATARALLAGRTVPDAPGTALAVAGTDAGLVEAFDAARLSSPSALRSFAQTHRGHPLADEALRMAGG